jgi:trehalose-phosphatase
MATRHSQLRTVAPAESEPADPAALARELAREARAREGLLLFADYDSVFRPCAPDRSRAGLPLLMRGALVALATTPDTRVVIGSMEDAQHLEARVNVPGIVYAGCRGLEIRGAGMSFCHPVAARLKDRVPSLGRELTESLAPVPGVEVEVRELGVSVHVSHADADAVPVVVAQAEEVRRTWGEEFRVTRSDHTVDLFPDVAWRKSSSALWILGRWMTEGHGRPAVVYLSGDRDEDTDLALGRLGHAVHVGRSSGDGVASHWVTDRTAAADLLARLAFAWSVQSVDG